MLRTVLISSDPERNQALSTILDDSSFPSDLLICGLEPEMARELADIRPQVVFVDVDEAGWDGMNAHTLPGAQLIATGRTFNPDVFTDISLGFREFLIYPFMPELVRAALVRTVKRAIRSESNGCRVARVVPVNTFRPASPEPQPLQ